LRIRLAKKRADDHSAVSGGLLTKEGKTRKREVRGGQKTWEEKQKTGPAPTNRKTAKKQGKKNALKKKQLRLIQPENLTPIAMQLSQLIAYGSNTFGVHRKKWKFRISAKIHY
jgi:hypothetical protein